ncbi:MAG: histidine phosphatase family protein [Bryobacteraceae bacterium]|nr:histidine phosphatase family protein [Bryobacteraceae bacterium]
MSTLTLVRHGQASYMEADYDKLSTLGEEQARKLGQYWARHRISPGRVIHGPAKRHIRTMEIAGQIVQDAGLFWPDPISEPAFDEFDAFTVMRIMLPRMTAHNTGIRRLSEQFETLRHSPEAGRILQKLFEEVCREWCGGAFDNDEAETWAQFRRRIASAVDHVRQTAVPSTHTVVFTSGGPIAATIGHSLGLNAVQTVEFVWLSRNCSYSQFLFSGDRFSLHAFNSVPHLDDLKLFTYR